MTTIYVGEDPGKQGFISWLDAYTLEHLGSVPTPCLEGKGETSDKASRKRLIESLQANYTVAAWVIEEQRAGFGMGSPNTFLIQGMGLGITKGMLFMAGVAMHEVTSQAWRKHSGTPVPRYPRAAEPKAKGKKRTKAEKAEHDAWKKADNARKAQQRKGGQVNVIHKVSDLYPGLDLRANTESKQAVKASPDKCVSILLARMGPALAPLTASAVEAGQGSLFE
jgi:hypothetical protein